MRKLLSHPITALIGVSVSIGIVLRRLLLKEAPWLWSFVRPIRPGELTWWARSATNNRDGAEPYALVLLVLLQFVLTVGAMALRAVLARRAPRAVPLVTAILLPAVIVLWVLDPPKAPWPDIEPSAFLATVVVVGALLATLVVLRAMRRQRGIPAIVAAALLPMCFISISLPSLLDLPCILAPALRLANGVRPSAIYLQYDLLPSLLGVAWSSLGGQALGFNLVVGASFYVLLLGLFWLGRRFFLRPELAAPMLVAVLIVRFYAVMIDSNATPQASPIRLDLWPILLATSLAWGLEHWAVGAVLGGLLIFSRSMGTLYLGSYALALGTDFLARRRAVPDTQRLPLAQDLGVAMRRLGPSLGAIGLAMIVSRFVFGRFGSDAIRLYREFGIGMMRITAPSFYWWLLPMTGAAGWLVYTRRADVPERPGQAGIFAVALLLGNSLYFFGRSHEHNLINISASYLFCFFLALDRAWPLLQADGGGPRTLRWILRATPFLVVAFCAYFYSGLVVRKISAQVTVAEGIRPLPPAYPNDVMPSINCAELARAAGDRRVYFFSKFDFWFYDTCHIVPSGYTQPLFLAILSKDIASELNHLLDAGYKIAVPRGSGDWGFTFGEVLPSLGNPQASETAQFVLYRRASP